MLATLGPYIAAIEHAALKAPFLVKGLTLRQRLVKMGNLVEYDHFLVTDFSRFDRHISTDILQIVEYFLLSFPFIQEFHPHFHEALILAQRTRGVAQGGITYLIDGTRCSGDAHTSIGNGLLNRFLIWLCLKALPRDAYISFHEGDDGIIAIKKEWVNQAYYNLQFLNVLGFSTKIEYVHGIENTTFCGRFIASTTAGMVDSADFFRALSKIHTTVSTLPAEALALAKALSYYHTDSNTPVIGAYCAMVIETLKHNPRATKARNLRRALQHTRTQRWVDQTSTDKTLKRPLNARLVQSSADSTLFGIISHRTDVPLASLIAVHAFYNTCAAVCCIPNDLPKFILDGVFETHNVTTNAFTYLTSLQFGY